MEFKKYQTKTLDKINLYLSETNKFEQALECKELWDINNGITLCEKCHNLVHKRKYNEFRSL